MQDSFLS